MYKDSMFDRDIMIKKCEMHFINYFVQQKNVNLA